MPGVTGGDRVARAAIAGSNWGNDVRVQGFKAGRTSTTNSRYNEVGPGYFRTMGIPLLAGREFTPSGRPWRSESRDRQRGVREEVQPRPRRGRQADGRRTATT